MHSAKNSPVRARLRTVALASGVMLLQAVQASAALITSVVETGGDNEATDTIVAQWTGQTFVNGVANEPLPNTAATDPYTVGLFDNHSPAFVDRNHRYTNASDTVFIPDYLLGGEYIMSGNDNRDNASYLLDVTVSGPVNVYLLIDDRLPDGDNTTPPQLGAGAMQWVLDEGWTPVMSGVNRTSDPTLPDEIAIDEGADGTLNQWYSIYTKAFAAGTFQLKQADNAGRNMYGVVVTTGEDPTNFPPAIVFSSPVNGAIFYASNSMTFDVKTVPPNSIATADIHLTVNGSDVSGSLTFGGQATNRTVTYGGLVPNQFYTATVSASDAAGRSSTNMVSFDTFGETTAMVIETEDYNYGVDGGGAPVIGVCSPGDPQPVTAHGGGFQDNPPPSGFTPTLTQINGNGIGYLDLAAVSGVDYSDTGTATGDATVNNYRTCTPVGVRATSDTRRSKYTDLDIGAWDLELHQLAAGEWLNYTRTFANTNFNVYLRARATTTQQVDLGRVTSDPTQGSQTVVPLGSFQVQSGTTYGYVPLTDSVGVPVVIGLSGMQTLRLTAVSANNDLNPNFLMLVPAAATATVIGPVLASASPAPDAANVAVGTAINLTITNRLTTLNTSSVQLSLDHSLVTATVTPNASGATVTYQPGSPFATGSTHTLTLVFRDNASPANSFTNEWMFTTTTDVTGPMLLSAVPRDQAYKVVLAFDEPLQKSSAETTANYAITNSSGVALTIVSATLANSSSNVTLLTVKQAENMQYTVRANGVRDAVDNPASSSATFTSWVLSPGFMLEERYTGVFAADGAVSANLADLLISPKYPANPDLVNYLLAAETGVDIADNFGRRVSGLLIPPETGPYTFFVSSDDQSMFYLSMDENPANKQLVAQEISWNASRTWTGDRSGGTRGSPPANISTNAIILTAGQKYYFELIHKEGTGGDNLGLNWQLPSQSAPPNNGDPTQITGSALASYAPSSGVSLTITQQPASQMALENQVASFAVAVSAMPSNAPVSYQWQVSTDAGATWSDLAGANGASFTTGLLTPTDNDKRYRVVLSTPGAAVTSDAATLTVGADTVAPTLRYRADGINALSTVTLYYSELMDPSSAANPAAYMIAGQGGALNVISAMMAPNGTNVVLTTGPQTQGERYVVTVVGQVLDLSGNAVAANSMAVFYSGGAADFARIDFGPSTGRAAPGWTQLSSTPATGDNGMNYATTQLTSVLGTDFTIAIDNVNTAGTAVGGLDWRDRGDSTATGDLVPLAEDLIKNNAGVIHVTLVNLPAGHYRATSYHADMTPGGANQSDNVRVFVNGVLQDNVRGNADQVLDVNTLTDADIQNSAATFEFDADGSNPVSLTFDGTVNISRTDTETPMNGILLQLVGGSIPNPTITLTAPTDGQTVPEGMDITVSADASPANPNDPITMVEFFANGMKIGEDTTAPYSIAWSGVARGAYEIHAVVTDKLEATATSESANIIVDSTPPALQFAWASVDSNNVVEVTLQFDEPLLDTTALTPANYSIMQAGTAITNIMAGRTNSVVLSVSGLSPNTAYTVSVSGISDTHGNDLTGSETATFMLPMVQINFQLASAPVPSGYLADGGTVYADQGNGYSYGWETDATDDTRDRDSANAFDQRYDTLCHLQRSGDNHTWEIALPNGSYDVHVATGDPDNSDQVSSLDIEGVIAEDTNGQADRMEEHVVHVDVTDGRLTIQAAPSGMNSKIMFLNIAPAAGGTTTIGPLSISYSGGNVTITWPGEGRLQESDTVDGTYTDVAGNPASGYTTQASEPQKFYRLAQ